jgi:phage tail protein X
MCRYYVGLIGLIELANLSTWGQSTYTRTLTVGARKLESNHSLAGNALSFKKNIQISLFEVGK